jgi:uncharacterized phage protein gp47/JayE
MFAIPTLTDLATRARQAFNAYLPGVDAWIARNNIAPTAKVFAGLLYELFERLDWVFRQAFVLYAEAEWLDRHGEQYGIIRLPAAPAQGFVTVTAGDAVLIPSGTQFALSNSGIVFEATADASLSAGGTVYLPVVALVAGEEANALPNAPLAISAGTGSGLSGNGASSALAAVGPDGISGGADIEADDPYRARILFRMRNPPHGGNAADYVMWASAVAGVTRVYVERLWRGAGTVRVFPVFDDLYASQGGIAPRAIIDSVIAALEPVQPSVAIVTVVAPTPYSINVVVSGLDPDTSSTRNAVLAELLDTFRRKGRVSGSDKVIGSMPYLARPHVFSAAWIQAAVANAEGVTADAVVSPTTDQIIPVGAMPVLGNLSFVA